jgi:hypothetical protein
MSQGTGSSDGSGIIHHPVPSGESQLIGSILDHESEDSSNATSELMRRFIGAGVGAGANPRSTSAPPIVSSHDEVWHQYWHYQPKPILH